MPEFRLAGQFGRFHNRGVLHLDQTGPSHFAQLREKLLNFFLALNKFDLDRKIFGQPKNPRAVQVMIGAKSGHTTHHVRARNSVVEEVIQNRRIQ